jgi:mersacidin/lichenicidin family type 2 lantibiotic
MPNEEIIRAWKDENYFHDLSQEARANIPNNPAGEMRDLSLEEISGIVGGVYTPSIPKSNLVLSAPMTQNPQVPDINQLMIDNNAKLNLPKTYAGIGILNYQIDRDQVSKGIICGAGQSKPGDRL